MGTIAILMDGSSSAQPLGGDEDKGIGGGGEGDGIQDFTRALGVREGGSVKAWHWGTMTGQLWG